MEGAVGVPIGPPGYSVADGIVEHVDDLRVRPRRQRQRDRQGEGQEAGDASPFHEWATSRGVALWVSLRPYCSMRYRMLARVSPMSEAARETLPPVCLRA